MKVRKRIEKRVFWEVNLLASIGCLLFMYLFLNSAGMINGAVSLLFSPGSGLLKYRTLTEGLFLIICKYGRDFLLGYALAIAIGYWMKREVHGIKITISICLLSELLIEVLRMFVVTSEILAPWNLFAEFSGTVFAVFFILIHERKIF